MNGFPFECNSMQYITKLVAFDYSTAKEERPTKETER